MYIPQYTKKALHPPPPFPFASISSHTLYDTCCAHHVSVFFFVFRLRQEEGVTSEGKGTDGSTCTGSVYGSSISMFVYIKNSIKRCTALTTGPTFLSLSKEFRTCLQQYAESLKNKCPAGSGQPPVYKVYSRLVMPRCASHLLDICSVIHALSSKSLWVISLISNDYILP